jgi:hypothetical protein
MAYDFQKLADVELLEEVPDGASAFVAVNGIVKRVPGSGLGGGGVATAILRQSSENNASTNATMKATIPVKKLPITCDNYTYAQARAVLESGNPITAMIFISENNMSGWLSCSQVALSDNYIVMLFNIGNRQTIYWNADGFFDREPANHNP